MRKERTIMNGELLNPVLENGFLTDGKSLGKSSMPEEIKLYHLND